MDRLGNEVKYRILIVGERMALLGYGSVVQSCMVAASLLEDHGLHATVVNAALQVSGSFHNSKHWNIAGGFDHCGRKINRRIWVSCYSVNGH